MMIAAAKLQTSIEIDEDREILLRTAQGDDSAFALLTERYSGRVYGFLKRMVYSAEDAEDLTQETFCEAHKNRRKLRTDVSPLPYLFTIARRKAISLIRWRKVRRIVLPLMDEHEAAEPDAGETPRDRMHEKRKEEIVEKILATLKPAKRGVLILRYFEGLSYREISSVIGKPEATVKSIAYRAEEELRSKLSDLRLYE
ncbi:MAG: RNA polymerase sigma factor [Candidatus Omnitrophota bacterium]